MKESVQEKNDWWKDGVRFKCQGSGKCCTSHGEYGYVYFTKDDRKKIAAFLKMRTGEFTKKYCERDEHAWRLKEHGADCIFLENKRCGVYEARPTQCRTWPFWPEVMNAKTWKKEMVTFCPGIGKGELVSGKEIAKLLEEQENPKF